MKLYPADYRSNDVVPLYFRSMFKSAGDGGTGSSSDRSRTVLMVGGVERRKNHVRSIKAFWQSGLPEQGYKLKITGPGDNCMNEVLELIAGKPSVEYLGFADAALSGIRGALVPESSGRFRDAGFGGTSPRLNTYCE
jgi:glycosyltransferase involved in cell wall biosynthesis